MMLIHAYCNIWCEARNGWKNLVKRRSAVAKINRLHDATSDELARYADVCSICYQDMDAAKRTGCGHMFHAMCLYAFCAALTLVERVRIFQKPKGKHYG